MEKMVFDMKILFGINGYGFLMISLGSMLLYLHQRHVGSDLMRFSQESHKTRQLWRFLKYKFSRAQQNVFNIKKVEPR